jgi:DNA-binding transcriptional ArsR family regulator
MAKKSREYTMNSLEQVRILSHPTRLKLLETLAECPRTTKQAAAILGVPATRLYHHVNALERVGLIKLKETRPVRGTVEKYYEAVARKIMVGAGLFPDQRLGEVLSSVLEEARRDLTDAMERMPTTPENLAPVALRATITASPAQLATLRKKLVALLKQPFGGKGARGRGAKARITFVFAAEAER